MKRFSFRVLLTALLFVALAWVTVQGVGIVHYGAIVDSEATAAICLGCHDGSAAMKIAPACASICTDEPHTGIYPARKDGYATLEAVLAAGLKLEERRITCITCHDLTNPDEYHLAVEQAPHDQKLCYICHVAIAERMGQQPLW
jgi:hypothetical protein